MLNFIDQQPQSEDTFQPLAPAKKYHELIPQEYLLGIAKRIKDETESERSKINARAIIQMCRRHRNMTPGDAFGFWNDRGVWCEHQSFSSLYSIPMYQELVVGAESNFGQAELRLNVKAVNQEFESRACEKIASDVYEVLDARQWNETNRQAMFYAMMNKLNAFFISRFNKQLGDDIPVPKFEGQSYEMGGMGVCTECYKPAEMSQMTDPVCEHCGNDQFSIIDQPQTVEDQLVSMFDLAKSGEAEMVIADGLDVSVDPKAKPADITSAGWVEWRVPAQKEELKRLYPHLECKGRAEWSYQLRLKLAFQRFENGEAAPRDKSDESLHEIRYIWLDPTEYEGYCAPTDFKLGNEVVIARGEDLSEKFPDGLAFGIVGTKEIAFVEGENKNKRISSALWVSDGVSFEGMGGKAGLALQRQINQLITVAMEGEVRSIKGSLLYNPDAIDGAMLEGANSNIPLRTDFAMAGGSFDQIAMPLKVEGLSQETLAMLDLLKQSMQEAMGIPDVILGQDTAEDPTFGGQALRSRNALGLLTPKTQSAARAKELWLRHQLDIIQTYYSPESLEQFGSRTGAEWLPDEIEAFFNADLDKVLDIAYVPGTEVPESRFEKSIRLRQDIAAGYIPLTPELQAQLAKESNYDIPEVNGYDSNLRLAENRFRTLSEVAPQAEQMYQQFEAMLTDPMTGQKAVDPMTGQPVMNPAVMNILNSIQVYQYEENHQQMIEYWSLKVRELAGSANASQLLLALCSGMVQRHIGVMDQTAMQQQRKMGMAQAAAAAPGEIGKAMVETEKEKAKAEMDPRKDVKK